MSWYNRNRTAVRAWISPRPELLLVAILLFQVNAHAQPPGPQPPCGRDPVPAYPALEEPANVKSWSKADFGGEWKPPECTGWTAEGYTTLVTTVARFRNDSGAEGLLRHIGAISELAGTRYWSTTHKKWQTLIVNARALAGPRSSETRDNFRLDEMKQGQTLYFEQADNLSGKATYRMRILEVLPERIVFNIENTSAMHYLFITLFHPGEMQSVYFLDRESENVWRFYSIVRTGKEASGLVAKNESSAMNRAVAFYRQLVGIPTDQEPPAAR